MAYTSSFIADNMYEISTTFNDEPIKFFVVVASSVDELDGLVEFHLNYLEIPQQLPILQPAPTPTLESIQTQIADLQSQIDSLITA
jgi:hypothetical protein